MARVTVEDCLDKLNNRFALVRLASRRAKQILTGANTVTDTHGNRAVVSALREIADGKVRFKKHEASEDIQIKSDLDVETDSDGAVQANA